MFHRIVCPNDQSELDFWKETDTHHVFKCPVCDYVRQGAVRHDLPERFEQLKAENERLQTLKKMCQAIVVYNEHRNSEGEQFLVRRDMFLKIKQAPKGVG